MHKHILLTGGTGLIGAQLTKTLLDKGYVVSHLSRKPGKNPRIKTYFWDVNAGKIDENCIIGVDVIIHLAGAPIAEKRWTESRKKELVESRTKSIELIYDLLRTKEHYVDTVISASAIGYYSDRGDEVLTEESIPAGDFLAHCCIDWENAVDKGKELGLRVVKLRTGVVLDKNGGALKSIALPIKLGLGSPLGSGKQWVPWIHWHDVIKVYLFAIMNTRMNGPYNMTAPHPVTNEQLTQAVAKQLKRPLFLPNVPSFILKFLLGEMSTMVLGSTRTSAEKIESTGFKFEYPDIEGALKQIYG